MTMTIPPELERLLQARAVQLHTQPEAVVHEALRWYLQIDPEFMDELNAWQEVRDEALDLVEEPPA